MPRPSTMSSSTGSSVGSQISPSQISKVESVVTDAPSVAPAPSNLEGGGAKALGTAQKVTDAVGACALIAGLPIGVLVPKGIRRLQDLVGWMNLFFFMISLITLATMFTNVHRAINDRCYMALECVEYLIDPNADGLLKLALSFMVIGFIMHTVSLASGSFGPWLLNTPNFLAYINLFAISLYTILISFIIVLSNSKKIWASMGITVAMMTIVGALIFCEMIIFLLGLILFVKWTAFRKSIPS